MKATQIVQEKWSSFSTGFSPAKHGLLMMLSVVIELVGKESIPPTQGF